MTSYISGIFNQSRRRVLLLAFVGVVGVAFGIPAVIFGQQYTLTYPDGTVTFNESDSAAYYQSQNFTSAAAVMQDYMNMSLHGGPWGPAHGLLGTETNAQGLLTSVTCNNGVGATAAYNSPAPPSTPSTPSAPAPAACVPDGSCSNTCGFGIDNCGNSCVDNSSCVAAPAPAAAPVSADNPWTNWSSYPGTQAQDNVAYTGPATFPIAAYQVIYSEQQGPQCSVQCIMESYLYDSCSQSIQYCAEGCAGNACIARTSAGGEAPIPPPTLDWSVTPVIVPKGQTTHVTWTSTHTSDCRVSGTNGDSWTGITGDTQSGPIQNQTVFTIVCTGLDGSTIQKQATVNIIPVFQEV